MRTLLIASLTLVLFLTSCEPNRKKTVTQETTTTEDDSLTEAVEARRTVDSLMNDVGDELLEEAKQPSPVEISNIAVHANGGDRIVSFEVKNISDKNMEGIRFMWHGENAFGEPADMNGGFDKTFGGGETDRTLRPGAAIALNFNLKHSDVKKNIIIWAKQIAFSDGSEWKPKHRSAIDQ